MYLLTESNVNFGIFVIKEGNSLSFILLSSSISVIIFFSILL